MPRSTTHVPTSEVHTTVSSTAARALRIPSLSVNGSIHHVQGSVRNSTDACLSCRGLPGQRCGDRLGVEAQEFRVARDAGLLVTERVRVERDDLDARVGRRAPRRRRWTRAPRRRSPARRLPRSRRRGRRAPTVRPRPGSTRRAARCRGSRTRSARRSSRARRGSSRAAGGPRERCRASRRSRSSRSVRSAVSASTQPSIVVAPGARFDERVTERRERLDRRGWGRARCAGRRHRGRRRPRSSASAAIGRVVTCSATSNTAVPSSATASMVSCNCASRSAPLATTSAASLIVSRSCIDGS